MTVPAGDESPATQPRTEDPTAPTSLPILGLVTLLDALFDETTGARPPDGCGADADGAGPPGAGAAAVCTAAERSIRSSTGFEICVPSQSKVTWRVSRETIL